MDFLDAFYAPQVAAAASRLEQLAAGVRQRANLLAAAAAGCEWDGAGARAFRHRAHESTTRLRRAAADLEAAAAALRRHADRVAEDVAREAAAREAFGERVRDELAEDLRALGDLIGAR